MIPKQFIDALNDRTAIEALVSSYVSLRRAGSNLIGLCPFHNEKTPSFTVFLSQNSFFCFGCSTGGDPINFIRKIENLDYVDAIEFLAKRAGMTVPQDDRGPTTQRRVDRNRILAMNREAALFFHRYLMSDNEDAKAGLRYLTESRHMSMTTVKHFGLGFAPNSYQALSTYLKQKGYTDEELIEGYMSFKNSSSSSLTDSFRNRVMFPIIDPAGNVVAFGGRVMDDSIPKYKNTSDTPAFKKSKHLFALNYARSACTEQLILCEGYMDVISMHAAGFENAVATLGTAITSEHARIISRYTKQVVISYDMDEAGRRAADKAMKLLEEVGVEVRVLNMQGAKDPDEYIQKFGKERFAQILEATNSKFEYYLSRELAGLSMDDPQQKIEAIWRLVRFIATIHSKAEQDIYIREVAKRFEVEVDSLRNDVKRVVYKLEKERAKKTSQDLQQKTMGYRDAVNPDFAKAPSIARYEESVLGLLLIYPEYREAVEKESVSLSADDFYTEFGRKVFSFIQSGGEEAQNLNEVFTADEVGRITEMKVSRMMLTENGEHVFEEAVTALKQGTQDQKSKDGGASFDALSALLRRKADDQQDS